MNTENNDLNSLLDNFNNPDDPSFNEKVKSQKKQLLDTRQGLIERVDKIFLTEDGRQLLREQY